MTTIDLPAYPRIEGGLLAQLYTENLPDWLSWLNSEPGRVVINVVSAVAVLIVGWILATVLSMFARGLLKRTQIDNRLAESVFGGMQSGKPPIEQWVAQAVYYIALLFTLVAVLNALNLTAVSEPLNAFLDRIFVYLPQVGGAIAWIAGGWLLASAAKLLLTNGLQAFRLDDRLSQSMGDEPGSSPLLLNETLGKIVYWFILVFFFYFALGTLGLEDQLEPIQSVLTDILEALPQILIAVLIGFVGWAIARIVRSLVKNLLATTGIDNFGNRLGLSPTQGRQALSSTLATVSYAVVLILTAISVLEELNIEAISDPAVAVLDQVLNALPRVFAAIAILVVAYFVGKFVSELVTSILAGIGFNNVLTWLGLEQQQPPAPGEVSPPPAAPVPPPSSAVPGQTPPAANTPLSQPATVDLARQSPSELVGTVVLVGIMLFASIAAVNLLEFEELTRVVAALTAIFGRIIVGVAVFAVGLYFANLAYRLIRSSGGRQANMLAQAARVVIIAFVSAMALQQIGIATDIVNLAFGLIGGAIAVAFAIAFGIGGRDVAAESIRNWREDFKRPD